MSLLTELTERLKQLPELKKLKSLNNDVQTLTTKVLEAHTTLAHCWNVRSRAQIVFPDESFTKTVGAVSGAAKQAGNLKQALENDFSEVDKRATEAKVTRLGDRAKQAETDLTKNWPQLMQRELRSYEAIAEVAAELPGGAALADIMERLRQRVERPPESQGAAESTREDLDALRQSIETLGLEGEAGQFLIQAAKGVADPRELFKEEIKKYFDEKNLWHVLAVKIK